MAQQTDSELTVEATVIQDETTAGANTATRVGQMLNDIIDSKINNDKIDTNVTLSADDTFVPSVPAAKGYIDGKIPYKSYAAIVSLSSGTFTVLTKQNDFTGVTFAYTNPSNGVINITASSAVFASNRATSPGSSLLGGGVAYFLVGSQLTTSIWNFDIVKHDGTQSGTPSFSQVLFEIRVYNS